MVLEEKEKIRKISESSVIFLDLLGNFSNLNQKPSLMSCISYSAYFKSNETEIVEIRLNLVVSRRSESLLLLDVNSHIVAILIISAIYFDKFDRYLKCSRGQVSNPCVDYLNCQCVHGFGGTKT